VKGKLGKEDEELSGCEETLTSINGNFSIENTGRIGPIGRKTGCTNTGVGILDFCQRVARGFVRSLVSDLSILSVNL
jgi:hypothetical protein